MLFNSYAFLLSFSRRGLSVPLADPYPRLRIPVLIALSLVFYSYWDVRFLPLMVVRCCSTGSPPNITRHRRRHHHHGGDRRRSRRARVLQIHEFSRRDMAALGFAIGSCSIALPLGISFFTFHHIMYLVDLRKGKAPVYPLGRYALYIAFFPQALAGPLARWSQVMEQFGSRFTRPAGSASSPRHPFIAMGLFEKIFLADPIGAHHRSDLCAGDAGSGLGRRRLAGAQLHDSRSCSILPAIPTSRSARPPVRRQAAVQFQRAVPLDQHSGFLAALAHDADDVPARLSSSIRWPTARIVHGRFRLCAVFRRDAADDGAVRPVAWRELDLRVVGALHGCALVFVLALAPLWPAMPSLLGWALTFTFVLLTGVIFRAGTLEAAWNIFQGLAVPPRSDAACAR